MDQPCGQIETIWARGSGQSLDKDEAKKWISEFDKHAPELTVNTYQLGAERFGGAQYPARKVSGERFLTGIGASISSGDMFSYGQSVDLGVSELVAYFAERRAKCSTSVFVLGGYSQGAQVAGEALFAIDGMGYERSVAFVALFGDPKLHLPEGRGPSAAACRHTRNHSTWRRTVPDCNTDGGSLGARVPRYLPDAFTHASTGGGPAFSEKPSWPISKAGSWCADADFVCGSSATLVTNSGHFTYAENGHIHQAVLEAIARARPFIPAAPPPTPYVDDRPLAGTTGLDLAILIDSTGSMSSYIESAKSQAARLASEVARVRGRVALIEYRDAGDAFVARTLRPLGDSLDTFSGALNGISVDGGGDTPEAGLAALMHTFNDLSWRPGATKAAVVLTDAPFHHPDAATGVTIADVARRSLEIDPVNVYPVVPDELAGAYRELADRTSGRVVTHGEDVGVAVIDAVTEIIERPVVLLRQTSYRGVVGDEFEFDASETYGGRGPLRFDWDFDGDGEFEVRDGSPIETFSYPDTFSGQMQVRVTDADDLISSMSVPVTVSDAQDVPPRPAAPHPLRSSVVPASGGGFSVELTWSSADSTADRWWIRTEDSVLGWVTKDRHSLTVTDFAPGDVPTFEIFGTNADGRAGEPARITVKGTSILNGVVVDDVGRPIENAQVTLLRAERADGPYFEVTAADGVIAGSSLSNPTSSDALGSFSWEVTPGWYQVRAEAPSCIPASSGGVEVPLESDGLNLALSCHRSGFPVPPSPPSTEPSPTTNPTPDPEIALETRVGIRLPRHRVTSNQRAVVNFAVVAIRGSGAGEPAIGTVSIVVSRSVVHTLTWDGTGFTGSVKLARLVHGRYPIRVLFTGEGYAASASAPLILTVARAKRQAH